MKKETLQDIVNDLIRFKPVVESICVLHTNAELATVKLLLFNIAQDVTGCNNYDQHDHENDIVKTIKALKAMNEFNGKHHPLLNYLVNQIDMIIQGHIMTADYEDSACERCHQVGGCICNPFDELDTNNPLLPTYACKSCGGHYDDLHDCRCGNNH